MISLQKSALSSCHGFRLDGNLTNRWTRAAGACFSTCFGAAEDVLIRAAASLKRQTAEEWCTSDRATDWTNMKPQKRLDYLCSLREEIAALRVVKCHMSHERVVTAADSGLP